jgi:hypothetical protein
MTDHAVLAPSSAAKRVACPGSRKLESLHPREESLASKEGTAAHWLAAAILQGENNNDELKIAPNGEVIVEEMIEAAQLYSEYITEIKGGKSESLHIEERVNIYSIHPECWGTVDAWYYDRENDHLHLFDYKYGHAYVDVYENWQLIEYAAGIYDAVNYHNITFHIVQPRNYSKEGPIRTWTTTYEKLSHYFNTLRASEAAAMQDNAPCNPNPLCGYCSGRAVCLALQRAALSITDIASDSTPLQLPPGAVGNELRYLQKSARLLEARITGLEEQALSMITTGEKVPYYTVEQTGGRERWVLSPSEIITMGKIMGVDLEKPGTLTPKQAAKLGFPSELITSFSERPRGSFKLVESQTNKAAKIFGGVK